MELLHQLEALIQHLIKEKHMKKEEKEDKSEKDDCPVVNTSVPDKRTPIIESEVHNV